MTRATALLEKHRRISEIVCCPQCRGPLHYAEATMLDDLPLSGTATCRQCGDVGCVANLKFILTPDDLPPVCGQSATLSGAVSLRTLPLGPEQFQPPEDWRFEPGQVWSDTPGARFVLECCGPGVSLVFLKHPWSGIARIMLDGREVATVDLFEKHGSMKLWYPIHLPGRRHRIEVEVTGTRNPGSSAAQVYLLGTAHLDLLPGVDTAIEYDSRNNGNPNPARFAELLEAAPADGLVLDCGSGDRSHPDTRVVSFEYSRFQAPDIFGDGHALPFREASFDLILSQAVFEHLYDPFLAASEIYRVLKPGGTVYVESAFMQPLHAVPYHFFNTTGWGLEHLFRNFKVEEVRHEGKLAQTLAWFYGITALRAKGHGTKVDQLLSLAGELDPHITEQELRQFSSYVTLLAKRPSGNR